MRFPSPVAIMIILQLAATIMLLLFPGSLPFFYFLQALARHACVYSQTTYLSSKSEKFPFIIITIFISLTMPTPLDMVHYTLRRSIRLSN
ncbi:hypothetical protein glysoja_011600 [Glycine soja]|nr:hypothetical protein glysoja_011600 [Glycine soja]